MLIKAINTGNGFITHEDREAFEIRNFGGDIWEVSGNYQAWITRVGGIEATTTDVARVTAMNQISVLEATVTNRRIREAALTQSGKDWLMARDSEIAALRTKL